MTRLIGLAGRLALAAFAFVFFAALLEGGSRLGYCLLKERRLSLIPREPASLFVRDRELLYRQRPGFDAPWGSAHPVRVRVNSLGLRGPERPLRPAPGTVRVLMLGDSQTWGFDVEESDAYPQVTDRLLAAETPRHEVWNAGVPGYSTYQGLVWLRRNLTAFRPRVVVAAFNFNDRFLAGEPSGDFSLVRQTPESFRTAWRVHWLQHSFALRKLRSLTARWRAARQRARFLEREEELLGRWQRLLPGVTLDEHARHLRAMARLCREHGVSLVLVALPEHPALAAPLDSAAARLAAGDAAGAVLAVRPYFALRDSVLLWTYSSYDLLANALMRRASPGSPAAWPHRRSPANLTLATAASYNLVAARVAAEEGVPFVDAAAPLSARPEVFLDECHFDARGHALVAELLLPVLRRAGRGAVRS